MDDYRWIIRRHKNGVYAVTGYIWVNKEWRQHGPAHRWAYIDGCLEHIRKFEAEFGQESHT